MDFIAIAFQIYFAATLGIAGLTKVDNPSLFERTLRKQRLLPLWSLKPISKFFPWIEVGLALALISGFEEKITVIVVLVLFLSFLGLKIYLFVAKSDAGCGCIGKSIYEKVDGISILISVILVLLAFIQVWLAYYIAPVQWVWRLFISVILVGGGLFLIVQIWLRYRKRASAPPQLIEPPSDIGLAIGERAPSFVARDQHGKIMALDDLQGSRRVLVFVAPGCPACPDALKTLKDPILQDLSIIALAIGGYDYGRNCLYASEQKLYIPFLTPELHFIEQVYKVQVFPITFVLNEEGIILKKAIIGRREELHMLLREAYQIAPNLI